MKLNPDIHTGRNVYADKDLYESDDTYKAKIDSYVNEGFKLVYGSPDDPSEGGGGSGGSGLVVNVNKEGSFNICDATWKTIRDAIANGASVYFKPSDSFYDDEYYIAIGCTSYAQSSEYRVYYYIPTTQMHGSYTATSEDGYPKVDLD